MVESQRDIMDSHRMLLSNPSRTIADEATCLIDLCAQVSIDINSDTAVRLVEYLDMVLEKNRVLNLTAIRDWDKALVLHLVDSLTLIEELDKQPLKIQERSFLDMGCGAGLPGIPLALARPQRKGVLCDSVGKKVKAVDEFICQLGLQDRLSTSNERLEALGVHRRNFFGCIVARAVAPLPVLVEYAAPLLSNHGELVVSKGVPSNEELADGNKVAQLCGFELLSRRSFDLPQAYGQRTILVYTKVSDPRVKLPRAIGMASKQPLA